MKTLFLTVSALIFSFSAAAETVHIYKCQNIEDFYVAISLEGRAGGNDTADAANDLCLSYGNNDSSFTSAAHALNSVAVNVSDFDSIKDDNAILRRKYNRIKAGHSLATRNRNAQSRYRDHKANKRNHGLNDRCWNRDVREIYNMSDEQFCF